MTCLAEWMMLAHGWRRFVTLLFAGAVAALSIPPLFVLPALFIAFPFWVWALDGAERRGGLQRIFGPAFWIGFAFGWGYFTVSFHWLGDAHLARIHAGLFRLAEHQVDDLVGDAVANLVWMTLGNRFRREQIG